MKVNMIDMHCDTFLRMMDPVKGKDIHLAKNNCHIDIEKLKKNGSSAQMFAIFTPAERLAGYGMEGRPYDFVKATYNRMMEEFALCSNDIAIARNTAEYYANRQAGKISAFLTIEEGCILEGKMERLDELYHMGFRVFGLIWMPENCNGFCNSRDPQLMAKGLKPFGIDVVRRANELGMILDVSHLSDGGFYDVAKYSKKPFVATHSNCRALANETRNLTDDMIRVLADHGGVAGLNLLPDFLDASEKSRIEYMVAHIKHICKVGGVETSAIGTDFDGMGGDLEIDNMGDMGLLFDALSKEGFSDDDIEKIAWKNALRVVKDVCG